MISILLCVKEDHSIVKDKQGFTQRQKNLLDVGLDPRGRDRLGSHGSAHLHVPPEDNLGRGLAKLLAQTLDDGVFQDLVASDWVT